MKHNDELEFCNQDQWIAIAHAGGLMLDKEVKVVGFVMLIKCVHKKTWTFNFWDNVIILF